MTFETAGNEDSCQTCTGPEERASASMSDCPACDKIDTVFQFAPGFPTMVKPDDLRFFDQLIGEAVIVRDEDMRICWCNNAYFKMGKGNTREEILGSQMSDFMAPIAAKEREDAFRAVMDSEKPAAHIHFCGDKRLLNVVLPLDKDAFGKRGVLILIKDAPSGMLWELTESIPMISTPCLDELDALSARELEVCGEDLDDWLEQNVLRAESRDQKSGLH